MSRFNFVAKKKSYLDANQREEVDRFLSQYDVINEKIERALCLHLNRIFLNMPLRFSAVRNYVRNIYIKSRASLSCGSN